MQQQQSSAPAQSRRADKFAFYICLVGAVGFVLADVIFGLSP